jgi:hypothetical protein
MPLGTYVAEQQGDQMSFEKKSSICFPTQFRTKLIHNLFSRKSRPKMWSTSVILTGESKHLPMGENSPNLVTLLSLKRQLLNG